MNVFVTGASGWIGSAASAELIAAGHRVSGLARTEESAAVLQAAGITPVRGSLTDIDVLGEAAGAADAVVHLGFVHDFADFAAAGRVEREAVTALGDALVGTDRPFIIASGVVGVRPGRLLTEEDASPFEGADSPRGGSENLALGYADRGVRAGVVRFAPTVHGQGDHGFVAAIVGIAREKRVSAYIGDGANVWPAVHRLDAAAVIRGAVEAGTAGARWHAVGDEGIPSREIAEAIGRGLDIPVVSITPEESAAHFSWISGFFAEDQPTSAALTRQRLSWTPTHPGLIEDLAPGSAYYATA